MWNSISLRDDYTASDVRALASGLKDAAQVRRLLSIAAVYEGMSRGDAARLGGMDRQTLRDWVLRFNAEGPDGLVDRWGGGQRARLTAAQRVELARIVEAGPDPETDGVVRWRCLNLIGVIKARFGVVYSERRVAEILHDLGFSHVSARPRHAKQDPQVMEDFKKTSAAHWRRP